MKANQNIHKYVIVEKIFAKNIGIILHEDDAKFREKNEQLTKIIQDYHNPTKKIQK